MRLGDLDELKNEFEWLESVVCECQKDSVRDSIQRVENATTIDPETLPIVRELREKLKKVTMERDALIWDMKIVGSGCYSCKHFDASKGKCRAEEPCGVNNNWEWRGIQGCRKMNDYIRRQDAIEAVKHAWAKDLEPTQYIEEIPSADVRPVVYGGWIFDSEWWDYVCTNCKGRVGNSKGYDFCPHCGADMRGKHDATP